MISQGGDNLNDSKANLVTYTSQKKRRNSKLMRSMSNISRSVADEDHFGNKQLGSTPSRQVNQKSKSTSRAKSNQTAPVADKKVTK